MKKNILILATTGDFLYKFELENVRLLQSMGYTVHYAANLKEENDIERRVIREKAKIPVHHIDAARSPYLLEKNRRAFWQLVCLIEKYEIQAIHCHTPVGGVLGRLAGLYFRKEKLKVLYTAHGFHFYQGAPLVNRWLYYGVERFLARFTDILVVINQEDYDNARRFRLREGGKLYRIPGVGLDMQRFSPLEQAERERRRKELGIGREELFLLSVGELNENKNHRVVLEALTRMKEESRETEKLRYVLCGEGFLRKYLREEIERRGLESQVHLLGYCMKIEEILGCADALIFPSKREGLGMAALEALAMGVPVIAAQNRGTREYMEPGRNGFVCRWNEPEDFIQGIEAIQRQTWKEKQEMKRCCRESAKKFEASRTRRVMEKVYQKLDEELEGETEDENQCYYGRLQS